MALCTTHKLVTIPADPMLDQERDDHKRDLLVVLHSIGNEANKISIAASSESKVRVIRSGHMFSLELSPGQFKSSDMVSLESEGKQVRMVVTSTSPLLNEV